MKKTVVVFLVLSLFVSMFTINTHSAAGRYVWNHTGSYVDDPFNYTFRIGSDCPQTGSVEFMTDVGFSKVFFPKIWATAHAQVTFEIVSGGVSVYEGSFQLYNAQYNSGDVPNVEIDLGTTLPAGRYVFNFSVPDGYYAFFAYGTGELPDGYIINERGHIMFGLWTTDEGKGFIEIDMDPGLSVAACNLSFENDVHIMYAVSGDSLENVRLLIWNSPQSSYIFGTHDAAISPEETRMLQGQEMLIFRYSGIAAKQMADTVYARAYCRAGGRYYYSEVKKYSVLQYAYNKLGKTGEATSQTKLKDVLNAMIKFGADAQKYCQYKTDRLATNDFYQIKVTGGIIDDLSSSGLYLPGDIVTVSAPLRDDSGKQFYCWIDSNDVIAGTGVTMDVTVGTQNEVYTAIYVSNIPSFSFRDNGDGTSTVSSVNTYGEPYVVIPSEAPNGRPVVATGTLFSGNSDLKSVAFPEGIKRIGDGTFAVCSALENVIVPSSVEEIGENAFSGCDSLETVYYEGGQSEWNLVAGSHNVSAEKVFGSYLNPSNDTPVTEAAPVYKKYFTMSFDDGITQDARIIQILKKYDMPCTFNINTGLYGVDWSAWLSDYAGIPVSHVRFTKAQIETGIYEGFDVEVHTIDHPDLASSYVQYGASYVIDQVKRDENNIAALTGKRPVGMAYPGGALSSTSDDVIRTILDNTNVRFARLAVNLSDPTQFAFPEYWMTWYPTASIGSGMTALNSLADAYIAADADKCDMLYYVWGHAYEIDMYDLWDEFEAFVKKMSEQDDVVFVTNAELYEIFKDEIPSWNN